jgi:4-diphosphocytidyl-2-C-methyl-D-erythritol kinase
LSPAPALPPLPAVLVNPAVPSPTGAVYRAYDAMGGAGACDRPSAPALPDVAAVAGWLSRCRNDLEPPACALEPRIGQALKAMAAQPESLLARMSGSGATCFALCASDEAAQAMAARLRREYPLWWTQPCRLGDAPGL